MGRPNNSAQRALCRYVVDDATGCWVWQGATRSGYGRVRFEGRLQNAHRVAYFVAHGAIPEGEIICHRCDNPPCINPAHLFAGSPRDNARDMTAKGRNRHIRSMSGADAAKVIRAYATGDYSHADLADLFGVDKRVVRLILSGRTYSVADTIPPTFPRRFSV